MGVRWIAEASSNHNGNLSRAEELVFAAAKAGFWGVKFQLFRMDSLFSKEAREAKPELADRVGWELPAHWIPHLTRLAHAQGIAFGLSMFARGQSQHYPDADFWKVSSYDLLRLDLIRELRWRPLIVSTGMADMGECLEARKAAIAKNPDVSFLHCVSSYPTPFSQCNLKAIEMMQKMLGLPIGWSDHSRHKEVVRRAVWRWRASVIELHVDLDDWAGWESKGGHCWKMSDAERLISDLTTSPLPNYLPRDHAIDGDGAKLPQPCEREERHWRADPSDGLRPMKYLRETLTTEKSNA